MNQELQDRTSLFMEMHKNTQAIPELSPAEKAALRQEALDIKEALNYTIPELTEFWADPANSDKDSPPSKIDSNTDRAFNTFYQTILMQTR